MESSSSDDDYSPQPQRSPASKSHDELIREYVRAAKAKIEAGQASSRRPTGNAPPTTSRAIPSLWTQSSIPDLSQSLDGARLPRFVKQPSKVPDPLSKPSYQSLRSITPIAELPAEPVELASRPCSTIVHSYAASAVHDPGEIAELDATGTAAVVNNLNASRHSPPPSSQRPAPPNSRSPLPPRTPIRLPTTTSVAPSPFHTKSSSDPYDLRQSVYTLDEELVPQPEEESDAESIAPTPVVREASVGHAYKSSVATIVSTTSHDASKHQPIAATVEDMSTSTESSRPPPFPAVPPKPMTRALPAQISEEVENPFSPGAPSTEAFPEHERTAASGSTSSPRLASNLSSSPKYSTLPTQQRSVRAPMKDSKRPAQLDMAAIRTAEERGSLTSLPDLIKRALRLASNLEGGRTASKFGTDWITDENTKRRITRRSSGYLGSTADIFPPTPHNREDRAIFVDGTSDIEKTPPAQHRRKCCGIRLPYFIAIIMAIILLIAAAILIPVCIVVIPNQSRSANQLQSLASCQNKLTCMNGGTNVVLSDNSCQCLCANGFSGRTCATRDSFGCTSTDLGVGATNVTIGDTLPRLIYASTSNYSIPLSAPTLVSIFASNGLSCTSENALVSLNGLTRRSVEHGIKFIDGGSLLSHSPHHRHYARQEAVTTNGLVIAGSAGPTATSTAASATSTASPAAFNATDQATLDFARTAVLYILQASDTLNTAILAQQQLTGAFSNPASAASGVVQIADGWEVNLVSWTVQGSNGTSVGGHAH